MSSERAAKTIRVPDGAAGSVAADVDRARVSWAALVPDVTPLRGPGARGFRAVFTSRTVAYLGSQGAEVALLVQAQRITGSPLVVGTLGLAELVPLVVFGLYGGVLADRFDRRGLMRWGGPGLALCGVLLLLNALLPHPLLWPLYVVAALMMAFASLQRPAFEAATPPLAPRVRGGDAPHRAAPAAHGRRRDLVAVHQRERAPGVVTRRRARGRARAVARLRARRGRLRRLVRAAEPGRAEAAAGYRGRR